MYMYTKLITVISIYYIKLRKKIYTPASAPNLFYIETDD